MSARANGERAEGALAGLLCLVVAGLAPARFALGYTASLIGLALVVLIACLLAGAGRHEHFMRGVALTIALGALLVFAVMDVAVLGVGAD